MPCYIEWEMIISRTPLRISFFGGGTDIPAWYRENSGAVLSSTIDRFCHVYCRPLPRALPWSFRLTGPSHSEQVSDIEDILHPSFRETLRFLGIRDRLDVLMSCDVPVKSGLGSSSAFTVGLLNVLRALREPNPSARELAMQAIHIEQEVLRENVGSQDQTAAAFGGFNKIEFEGEHRISVTPLAIDTERMQCLETRLMLFFTGFSRNADEIEADKIRHMSGRRTELLELSALVAEAERVLIGTTDLNEFGRLLNISWSLKRRLSEKVSNTALDSIHERALRAGAVGGKLLGAGGGGFILFYVEPGNRDSVRQALRDLPLVPFRFHHEGSRILERVRQARVLENAVAL